MKKIILLLLLLSASVFAQITPPPTNTIAYSKITNVPNNTWAWRGIGQGMESNSIQYNFSNGISSTLHSRHYSPIRFREVRAVIPTFAPNIVSGTVTDQIHPFGLNFQVAFEPTFQASLTGLTPRQLFTFSGSPVANYAVVTGVSITQGSATGTVTNVLGTYANGQPLFCGTAIAGYIQSISGTTLTLSSNYTGSTITATNCTTNNGATQQAGYIESDIMDIGSYYTPGTTSAPNFYGLHTTVENPTQTLITAGTFTTGTNTLTMTSVSGPFGIGYPVYTSSGTFIGTVATVVSAGTSYTLTSTYGTTLTSVAMQSQGLPIQQSVSSFINRNIGSIGVTTLAATTSATASNSATVTLAGTSSGWSVGKIFNAVGGTVPNGTYVIGLGTSSGGNGTIFLNNAVTVAGVAATGSQSNITLNTASSSASYNIVSTAPAGGQSYYTPAFLMVNTNSSLPFITLITDSIGVGADEGVGSTPFTGTVTGNTTLTVSGVGGVPIWIGMPVYTISPTTLIGTITGGSGTSWTITSTANIGPVQMYGITGGTAGTLYGDAEGSAFGNRGWIERGINEVAGYSEVNLGRSSDANYMWETLSNSLYRRQLLALSNPTHVINAMVHNDISHFPNTIASAWVANTAYAKYAVVSGSGATGDYICVVAGTSGNVALTGTTYGANITDGTAVWQYLFPHVAVGNSEGGTTTVAAIANVNSIIKSIVPGVNIIQQIPTVDVATTTDQYATTANQTATLGGWRVNGGTYSTRNTIVSMFGTASVQSLMNVNTYVDPNVYLEYLGSSGSDLWIVNGNPYGCTYDGTHPNSFCNYFGQSAINTGLFTSTY